MPLPSSRPLTPTVGRADLRISDAARAVGLEPSTLRAWGERYGWPSPPRTGGGGRSFSPALVQLIRRVVARRDSGVPISEIIGMGYPVLPDAAAPPRPVDPVADLTGIQTPAGQDLWHAIAAALRGGAPAARVQAYLDAHLPRIHPDDRDALRRLVAGYLENRP